MATNSRKSELDLELIFCQLGIGIESPGIGIEELELGWNWHPYPWMMRSNQDWMSDTNSGVGKSRIAGKCSSMG